MWASSEFEVFENLDIKRWSIRLLERWLDSGHCFSVVYLMLVQCA